MYAYCRNTVVSRFYTLASEKEEKETRCRGSNF